MHFTPTTEVTLLEAVIQMAPDSSKTSCKSWIKEGRIFVDGKAEKSATFVVRAGQNVTLGTKSKFAVKSELPIVYQDGHLVVIDKPHGLLSVSTKFEEQRTAHTILKEHFRPRRVFVVHRLDQDTSGLLLFALDEGIFEKLKTAFAKHEIERTYYAIVDGIIEENKGTWTSYQYEDDTYYVHNSDDPSKGVIAITHYRVLGRSKKATWLQLDLETGRKNQIRAHCQMAGHPILGDEKYGSERNPLGRMALHAKELRFIHPANGRPMKFSSPTPAAFHRLVNIRAS